MDRAEICFLQLDGQSIYEQLLLEEALLRADGRNFCIVNRGSTPHIVMGISGKADELVDEAQRRRLSLPLLRRYSGGGTVVVDEQTLFVTFIGNSADLAVEPFPKPIMHWTADLYRELLPPSFALRENDYAIGDRKCGGNAQYISRGRWVHHTSWLWDWCPERMAALRLPARRPAWRADRAHGDFLCRLSDEYGGSAEGFCAALAAALQRRYRLRRLSLDAAAPALQRAHRRATAYVA